MKELSEAMLTEAAQKSSLHIRASNGGVLFKAQALHFQNAKSGFQVWV